MILWQGSLNHWLSQDSQESISGESTSNKQYSSEDLSPLMKQARLDAARMLLLDKVLLHSQHRQHGLGFTVFQAAM